MCSNISNLRRRKSVQLFQLKSALTKEQAQLKLATANANGKGIDFNALRSKCSDSKRCFSENKTLLYQRAASIYQEILKDKTSQVNLVITAACYCFGGLYAQGKGVDQGLVLAKAYFLKFCFERNVDVCEAYMRLCENSCYLSNDA